MSIASEITRLQGVKADILTAIADKGVDVPAGSALDDCPDLIGQISGGGGGSYPCLYYVGDCWRFDKDVAKVEEDSARLELYHYTNDLNVQNKKNIYISYKIKFLNNIMVEKRILDTSRSAGRRLISTNIDSGSVLQTSLRYNTNGRVYKEYTGLETILANTEYFFEHYLDFENNLYKFTLNNVVKVNDSTINASELDAQYFTPSLGSSAGSNASNLIPGLCVFRSFCDIKIDGVSVIPKENLG